MIKSELDLFLNRRKENIKELDRLQFPLSVVRDERNWPTLNSKLSDIFIKTQNTKIKVLAEIKKKSPSLGALSETDALALCESFLNGGADAISILVDNVNFGGTPKDLSTCTKAFKDTPFLYKDFVMSDYQVYLARTLGASNILLMTQVLEDEELKALFDLSVSIGLEPFIEVHNSDQLDRALKLNPNIIGINARDFSEKGLPIDLCNAGKILTNFLQNQSWPEQCFLIAQSGIDSEESYRTVVDACPDNFPHAVQIGSSVSKSGKLPDWLF